MEKKLTKKQAKQYVLNNNGVVGSDLDGFVVLNNIGKVYDGRVQAVFNFNLSIQPQEFIVFVGPSGCGKSTTLRMVAGLEEITDGRLYIDGKLANYLESKDRNIAMVFQSYALYPNMTVYDNIGFGLSVRRVPKDVIREKVYEAARILDLGPYLDRKPKELSGGQMQRVALGRAIVRDAKLFLMDEPLSNLDAKLRVQMRSEIVKLHREIGATTIYVTHDQTEAMTMANRIVVMNKGIIQQVGTPMDIYNNPQNVFVATFIGNPPMNVFNVEAVGNQIIDGANVLNLPKQSVQTYADYVVERQNYFTRLAMQADVTDEKALTKDISVACQTIGRKRHPEGEELLAEVALILERIIALRDKKGFLDFSEENKQDLLNAATEGDKGMVISILKSVSQALNQSELMVAGLLKVVESAGLNVKKEEISYDNGKKNKKKATAQRPLVEENTEKISKYLAEYGADGANSRIMLGIRPENIHFYSDNVANKSDKFTVTADFVELLGSEFCIHFNLFGKRLIMKTGTSRMVAIGETIEVCFDMDEIKLFDAISGAFVCK